MRKWLVNFVASLWVEAIERGKYTDEDWRGQPRPQVALNGDGIWLPRYLTTNDFHGLNQGMQNLKERIQKLELENEKLKDYLKIKLVTEFNQEVNAK